MEFWLDGVDRGTIELAKDHGLLHGVTTNPSILAKTGRPVEDILEEFTNYFSGPIAVQVTCRGAHEMIDQGKDLYDFSSRIIVKIPVTQEGIRAIFRLSHYEIPTMGTAVFTPLQAFLAAKAGARYLAPYFSHMGEGAHATLQAIQEMLKAHRLTTKLCIASLNAPQDVEACLLQGFSALTLKPELFKKCLIAPNQVEEHLARFEADWSHAAPSQLLTSPELIKW